VIGTGAFAALVIVLAALPGARAQSSDGPEDVLIHSGRITLHALLWRPQGRGPFPAILFNHGSGRTRGELERLGPYETQAETLGSMRRVSQYEQEKRLARAKRVLDVRTSFTEAQIEAENPALPAKVQ